MDILNGIRLGQYEFNIDTVIEELKWRVLASKMNYAAFSATGTYESIWDNKNEHLDEKMIEIAKFMTENKIYFSFTNGAPSMEFGLKKETLSEIKKIAGDYYIGNFICELGSKYGCCGSDYGHEANPGKNLKELKDGFVKYINDTIAEAEIPDELKNEMTIIEATSLLPYVMEANAAFPVLETMCGNPEIMLPLLRGTAKAWNAKRYITYIAHEWYAGVRNHDTLKLKRLRMIYDYAYLCGSSCFLLESGELRLQSHDAFEGYNNPTSQFYRDTLKSFAEFAEKDNRPDGGPKVKFAFVQGNLDGWSSWNCGSSIWNKFGETDYGYSAPEFTWRIMDDINSRRNWCDVNNFGDTDLSGAPAYGQYDIINAAVPLEALMQYDYLIFTGWNTMTPEIYDKLKEYVKQGGRLLMTAAHLNTDVTRDGRIDLINGGDVSDLFGCKLDAENSFVTNCGFKFNESIMEDVLYPSDMHFDPLFSSGYAKYAKTELCGGVPATILSQAFNEKRNTFGQPAMVENKLGDGYAMLITGLEYPGNGALYSVYKAIVREYLTASHRGCDIKVYGSDKLRFAVYEGDVVYLLNTDFDSEIIVTVERGGEKINVNLAPCEMKSI